jgi:hypothetical protein
MRYLILTLEYTQIPTSYGLKMSLKFVKLQEFLGGLHRLKLYGLIEHIIIYSYSTFWHAVGSSNVGTRRNSSTAQPLGQG